MYKNVFLSLVFFLWDCFDSKKALAHESGIPSLVSKFGFFCLFWFPLNELWCFDYLYRKRFDELFLFSIKMKRLWFRTGCSWSPACNFSFSIVKFVHVKSCAFNLFSFVFIDQVTMDANRYNLPEII